MEFKMIDLNVIKIYILNLTLQNNWPIKQFKKLVFLLCQKIV